MKVAYAVSVIMCIASACDENCYPLTLVMDTDEEWPTLDSFVDYPEGYVDRQHPEDYNAIS